ncbi:MAG: HlyD family efflux transporter periplasmic adaptor subunit [Mesorhizobium sp.]|uniref:HlyD family secretion protein n=1 Tax=Mesorhizobium sp. TaxID=1871066 RepID=UPI0012032905|nr:HlyD family efflux transporter periplasmic adaptor subunit [Mesorhizobium sp.]TIO51261.1 MAG: HlyD family efflux transporter periplasmic adaptor subunit [Mesorhizobium sp.]TIO55886.1 MAG: HlyD family efflux transporter periplasmic adaptor subunit [Mesorhizobium sp.]TJV56143.1 MAG: HlyD family efflux transporter periplasmic adaptor subunit [Mesorhizobium sp.]
MLTGESRSEAPIPVSLFRKEALAARRDAWLGRPQLLQPISVQTATGLAVVAVVLIGSVLILGEYTRRVRVSGTVAPSAGVTRVFAPQAGRIVQSAVSEGVAVRRGDSLYTIGLDSVTDLGETEAIVESQLRTQRAELQEEISRRAELDRIDKKGLYEQERILKREIERIDTQIADTADYLAVLKESADKYKQLVNRRITIQREFEFRQQSYMQTRQELQGLKRQRVQLDGRLEEVHSKLDGFDANAAIVIGELRQRAAAMDQQLAQGAARRAINVTAPRDGTITAILGKSGQMIAPGAPLLSILPTEGQMEIHLMAQSRAIGFVREGTHVLLRYAAFPYQKFGQYPGIVKRISRAPLRPSDLDGISDMGGQSNPVAPLYQITVQPQVQDVVAYGKAEPLRAGMEVEAELLLDTRPLYQWILEPLYSLRGGVASQSTSTWQ